MIQIACIFLISVSFYYLIIDSRDKQSCDEVVQAKIIRTLSTRYDCTRYYEYIVNNEKFTYTKSNTKYNTKYASSYKVWKCHDTPIIYVSYVSDKPFIHKVNGDKYEKIYWKTFLLGSIIIDSIILLLISIAIKIGYSLQKDSYDTVVCGEGGDVGFLIV